MTSDETTTTIELESDGTIWEIQPDGSRVVGVDQTDRARLAAMTEDEIVANARSDPDNPPMAAEELRRMRPVPNPRRIRKQLKLSQLEFAETFHIPLGTLRDWEQRVTEPNLTAKTLLRVIEQDPEGVKAALAKSYEKTR